ncbi:MAG: helicase-associated domain-containing protein [Chloroflexi bacterium]|nr:helicase-associated domain-containing protein [Chloroflexota bacterium]
MSKLEDFTTWLKADPKFKRQGLRAIPGANFPDLTKSQVQAIFESYTLPALEIVCRGRGLTVEVKLTGANRANYSAALAAVFDNPDSIDQALAQLSPATRYGLALLKETAGGIANRTEWRQRMVVRYGAAGPDQAEQELIGKALALYATSSDRISFSEVKSKQAVGKPGFYNSLIAVFPSVLNRFVEGAALQELLQATLPPLYQELSELHPANPANFEALLQDLFSIVRYLEANNVKLLQNGEPSKRDFSKLQNLMKLKDRRPLTEARKLIDLPRLTLVWNLLLTTELVSTPVNSRSELVAQVQPQKVAAFFALSRHQQVRTITMAWLHSSSNEFLKIPSLHIINTDPIATDVPNEKTLKTAREFVLGLLEDLALRHHLPPSANQWVDLPSFQSYVQELNVELLVSRQHRPYLQSSSFVVRERHGYFSGSYYNGFTSSLVESREIEWSRKAQAAILERDWRVVEGEWLTHLFRESLAWLGLAELGLNQAEQPVAWRLTELGWSVLGRDQPALPLESGDSSTARLSVSSFSPINVESNGQPNVLALQSKQCLIVQPNFEVLVLEPLQHMRELHQLDRFATQESFGEVARYRLSKESLLKGLRVGLNGIEILAFLTEYSRVPLSQNLIASIQDWSNSFERLLLRPAANLLEVDDPKLLDQLMDDPLGSNLIEKRFSPTLALLRANPTREQGKVITEKAGSPPEQPSEDKLALERFRVQQRKENKNRLQLAVADSLSINEIKDNVSVQTLEELLSRFGVPKPLLILEYRQIRAGALQFEGENGIKVKAGCGTPYLYYRLGQFAELVTWEASKQSAKFKLSLEASQRAQSLNLTYPEVARFLEQWCGTRTVLPTVTRLMLKNWLGYYPALIGYHTISLKAASAEQLDELFSLTEFAPLLIERASPLVALIREELLSQYRERLLVLGVAIEIEGVEV